MPRTEDNLVHIETPEAVWLTFQVAGPGARMGAYLLDLLFRIAILYVLNWVLSFIVSGLGGTAAWPQGVLLLAFFILEWGYSTLFETFNNGRTPGKRIVGLRVIKTGGYPVGFYDAFMRNLLRAADGLPLLVFGVFLPTYGVSLLVMLMNPKMQRVGDLIAGTMVVREKKARLRANPGFVDLVQPIPRAQLRSGYRPSERLLDLIELLHQKQHQLLPGRREEIALTLATPLAERLGYDGRDEAEKNAPIDFLYRVYKTFQPQDTSTRSQKLSSAPPEDPEDTIPTPLGSTALETPPIEPEWIDASDPAQPTETGEIESRDAQELREPEVDATKKTEAEDEPTSESEHTSKEEETWGDPA